MTTATQMVKCPKCGGHGHIPEYAGIAGGVCFKCNGAGKVEFKKTRQNKYSPINAMHCRTVAEAHAYRMAEFTRRFPELAGKVTPELEYAIKNGCGSLKKILAGVAA